MLQRKEKPIPHEDECLVCSSPLSESSFNELLIDSLCSYECKDEYQALLEDRYYKYDRWNAEEGRPE